MSKSVDARLRERIVYSERTGYDRVKVSRAELADLLYVMEAMAAVEPVDWNGERACLYCRVNIEDGDDHEPNCPHIRARELCGKEQDGAE